jgi:hypothetical protein
MKKGKPKQKHRYLRFNPEDQFEVAKAVSSAIKNLGFDNQKRVLAWALEHQGHAYPIKITSRAAYP